MESFKSHWYYWVLGAVALIAVYAFSTGKFKLSDLSPVGIAVAADKGGPPQPNIIADVPVAKVNWTSLYVGGFAGYGAADAALTDHWGHSLDGLSATGRVWGVTLGGDWQLPGSFLVIGARGNYSWSDENFTLGSFKAGIRDGWSADGRVGAAFGTAMPYIGLGTTTVHTAATGVTSPPDLHGLRYISGVEFRLPKIDTGTLLTPTLAVEVVYTDFDSKTFGTGTHTITLNPSDLTAMLRLNLHIGR